MGYVKHLREHHPDAAMPEVFADEPLLENADGLRATLGDDAFFSALAGGDGDDGWGDLSGWDAARYDAARAAPVGDDERTLLVQSLLDTLLTGFAHAAVANAAGYVDMDAGLAAISRHAQSLGYAGVILFLDELILWLLSRMADVAFATEEASKISKLVEGAMGDRPVPIVGLIARQRDLRELVGSEVPGLEKMAFVDQLDFQGGRFSNIVLNDSNLPVVAHHRLLKPSSEAGASALAAAFRDLELTAEQRDALSGEFGGVEAFQLTYPFSPAFLQIVVDVAGALQRTRTGLRVLLQLLVDNRDRLTVGDLVPVGELYDVLASSEDPLTEEMKASFAQAKRIYATRLRPLLLSTHGLGDHDEPTGPFLVDDRLVKTLLLAALVPTSAAFKDLTASRLVALNHGLITSPVPGTEVSSVVGKLRTWASQMGEMQVGDDPHNPTVAIVLSDVDTRAILDIVRGNDNTGSRRQLIRDLIVEELGLPPGQMIHTLRLDWKGVRREVDVRFGNVRDPENLSESAFADEGGRWKVIVDFPFDDEGHGPNEDLRRLEELRASGRSWRTIAWLPSFFTAQTLTVLGDLVKLNFLLATPDRYNDATKNLSPTARAAARPQLEAQQVASRQRLGQAIRMAYGVIGADAATIDSSHALSDHFPSLQAGLVIRPPVAAGLKDALDDVVSQALAYSYPGAPALEREAKTADLRKVFEVVQQALDHPDGRMPHVPSVDRNLMRAIANPLRLGTQSEQAFVVDGVAGYWDLRFTKRLAERGSESGAAATVADLRRWIDEPDAMGLTKPLQDLVLISWAAATNRTFRDHGGPARVAIDQLADHLEVVAQPLPTDAVWGVARDRAERIFGVPHLPDAPSANGLARLSASLLDRSEAVRSDVAALPGALHRARRAGGGRGRVASNGDRSQRDGAHRCAPRRRRRPCTLRGTRRRDGRSLTRSGGHVDRDGRLRAQRHPADRRRAAGPPRFGRPEGAAGRSAADAAAGRRARAAARRRAVVDLRLGPHGGLDTAPPVAPPPSAPVPEPPPAPPGTRVVEVVPRHRRGGAPAGRAP